MIQSGDIEGHIEQSTFVRTKKKPKYRKITEKDARNVHSTLLDLLRGADTLDIENLEKETASQEGLGQDFRQLIYCQLLWQMLFVLINSVLKYRITRNIYFSNSQQILLSLILRRMLF